MRVIYKPTGQTGTIPDTSFNPQLYEQIGTDHPIVPPQQTQQSVGTTTNGIPGMPQDPNALRLFFVQKMMENPKQAAYIKSVYDMAKPPDPQEGDPGYQKKLSASEKTASDFVGSALDQLNNITGQTDFSSTGPISGWFNKTFRDILPNMVDRKQTQTQAYIGPLRDSILNLISGANVSAAEADRVKAWIPDISKSPQSNKEDLNALRNWLQTRYESTTGKEYVSKKKGSSKPPLSSFDQ